MVAARVRELREFAATLDQNPRNVEFELHEKDVTGGYAAWPATYDEPVNPLVSLEQPIPKTGPTESSNSTWMRQRGQ